jgi:hypothetical protein
MVDILVPDAVWEQIRPDKFRPKGAGMMCGPCILAAIEQLEEHEAYTLCDHHNLRECPLITLHEKRLAAAEAVCQELRKVITARVTEADWAALTALLTDWMEIVPDHIRYG